MQFDLIVIGRGLAGLKAAESAAHERLRTASIESELFGGLVSGINELEGLPLAIGAVSGVSLAGDLMTRGTDLGVEQISATVEAVVRETGGFRVRTDDGEYASARVIVATGARRRALGIPGEAEFRYRGVSECADCDGPLYSGQDAVVIGGGDSAVQEATALSAHARTVHLVHRGQKFSARGDLEAAMRARPNIVLHMGHTAEAILGTEGVTGVHLRDVVSGASTDLQCRGVFVYVGLDPATELLPPEVARDAAGAILTSATMESSVPGLFAIGAVRAGYQGRIADAWDEAEMAVAAAKAGC